MEKNTNLFVGFVSYFMCFVFYIHSYKTLEDSSTLENGPASFLAEAAG